MQYVIILLICKKKKEIGQSNSEGTISNAFLLFERIYEMKAWQKFKG